MTRTFQQTDRPRERAVRLSPCPCCSGAARNRKVSGMPAGERNCYARCDNCGMQTDLHETPKHAAAVWNRRNR